MKIAFHGAARTVTGSKHLISLTNGKKYLLDCGMFQGMGKDTDRLNRNWGFEPRDVTHLILSHAHIDHSGLIPKLVKDGFGGKIFCTPATKDLTTILLEDSAEIQEDEVKYENKRRAAEGIPIYNPYIQPMTREQRWIFFNRCNMDNGQGWMRMWNCFTLMRAILLGARQFI
jgi:metallo-beta-lactamase family protein